MVVFGKEILEWPKDDFRNTFLGLRITFGVIWRKQASEGQRHPLLAFL